MSNFSQGSAADVGAGATGYICAAGVTYAAQWWMEEGGYIRDIRYIKGDGTTGDPRVDFPTGWKWGACILQRHTFRATQALAAGANVITHNLNLAASALVDVRDATTGERIEVTVPSETALTVTINTVAAVANAKITVVAVEA